MESSTITNFSLSCSDVPKALLNRNNARMYFQQFGDLIKLRIRAKEKIIEIDYSDNNAAELALKEGGCYDNFQFKITWRKRKVNKFPSKTYIRKERKTTTKKNILLKDHKNKNYDQQWKSIIQKINPRVDAIKSKAYMELLKSIMTCAKTSEEKYRILDARDELIRLELEKNQGLFSSNGRTIGTCPDMCPEKERILRQIQHQVSGYEQTTNDNTENRILDHALAVKQYSRSSADQKAALAHELRPILVLRRTMQHLLRVMDLGDETDVNLREWYHFLWDRTRAIRKDITQQELCCLKSVALIEQCARFHIHCAARLVAEESTIFDAKINSENLTKCLQTLKYMYHDLRVQHNILCPHEAEFRSYIVLLNLHNGNFMWEIKQLGSKLLQSVELQFAIKVFLAVDNNNYVSFFRLVKCTTYLNACILLRYFPQVRQRALIVLLKAQPPRGASYPIKDLTNSLGFENDSETISFVQDYNLEVSNDNLQVMLVQKRFEIPSDLPIIKRALRVVESKRISPVSEVVFGSRLPHSNSRCYIPHESFTFDGYLKVSEVPKEFRAKYSQFLSKSKTKQVTTKNNCQIISDTNVIINDELLNSEIQNSNDNLVFSNKEPATSTEKVVATTNISSNKNTLVLNEKSNSSSNDTFTFIQHSSDKDRISSNDKFKRTTTTQPTFKKLISRKNEIFRNKIASNKIILNENKKSTYKKELEKLSEAQKLQLIVHQKKLQELKDEVELKTKLKREKNLKESLLKRQLEKRLFTEEITTMFNNKIEDELNRRKEFENLMVGDIFTELQYRKEEENRRIEAELRFQEEIKRQEEIRRINELKQLEELKKQEELKIQEQLKRQEELKLQEELTKYQQELIRLKQQTEARKRDAEINTDVQLTMCDLLNKVKGNVLQLKANELLKRVHNRLLKKYFYIWRYETDLSIIKRNALINKKKSNKTYSFAIPNQQLNLEDMERYKNGFSNIITFPKPKKLNLLNINAIVWKTLYKKMAFTDNILNTDLYWKIGISTPDIYSKKTVTFNEHLQNLFGWEEYDNCLYTTKRNINSNGSSLTYCVKSVSNYENNLQGLIFIVFNNQSSEETYNRLKVLLQDMITPIPVIIFLDNFGSNNINIINNLHLEELKEQEIINKYQFIVCSKINVDNSFEESLMFLASNVPILPRIEMNSLHNFLDSCLGEEFWCKLISSLHNKKLRKLLRIPNIIIKLYNEAFSKVYNIIFDEETLNHPTFPKEFKRFVKTEKIALPCTYKYFPEYWKSYNYLKTIELLVKSFSLPYYNFTWPPKNISEFQADITNYCSTLFKNPSNVVLKILQTIVANSDDIFIKSWINIINIIFIEKLIGLKQSDDEYELYTVVYNITKLNEYKNFPWIDILVTMEKNLNLTNSANEIDFFELNHNPLMDYMETPTIDSNETKNNIEILKSDLSSTNDSSNKIKNLNDMLNDLECSLNIHFDIFNKWKEKYILKNK